MTENIRMDSHKLIYHPQAVADWLRTGDSYPVEIEISPSGACNHRCIFCAVDYVGYHSDFLRKDIILRDIAFLAGHGLKSVICSGEGEPLLNKDLPDIVNNIKTLGIDVAMSSNAVLLTEEVVRECLSAFTWVRFSVASTNPESYLHIQRGRPQDLDLVLRNIDYAVQYKRERKIKTTIGVQCLLIRDNLPQVVEQAKNLRNIGVDYFTVKPYSQHLHSQNHLAVDYSELQALEKELKACETDSFRIYYRANAMQKMHKAKPYAKCLGLPFMTHIDAKGNVWPCIAHLGVKGMNYGNIYEQTFEEIWHSEQRRKTIQRINDADINAICRDACRLDEINKYLNELKHPGEHVNFI